MTILPFLRARSGSGLAGSWRGATCRAFCVLLLVIPVGVAFGQSFPRAQREAPQQALALTVDLINFQYAGEATPAVRFDYSGPALGLTYSRPNLLIAGVYGPPSSAALDTAKASLIDLSLSTWGRVPLAPRSPDEKTRSRLYLPVGLLSNYRRVRQSDAPDSLNGDEFSVTTLGLTAGLGVESHLRKGTVLQARLTPGLGFATRSFGDASGLTTLLDSDVQVSFGPVAGHYAISVGYGFRYMDWHLRVRRFLLSGAAVGPRDFYDYRTLQHGFRVGVGF